MDNKYNKSKNRLILFLALILFTSSFASIVFALGENKTSKSDKHYNEGVKLLNENKLLPAIKELETAVEVNDKNYMAHLSLGKIFLKKTKAKYYNKAPEHFSKVMELINNPADKDYLDSSYYLSIAYLQLGEYDKAITSFLKTLELDSNYPEKVKIFNYLGMAFFYKGNYAKSAYYLRIALHIDPTDKIAINNLKRVEEPLTHYNIGITYFNSNDFDEAQKEFANAVKLDSKYFDAHLMLGECYLKQGDTKKAISEFKRTMMINPEHPEMKQVFNKTGEAFFTDGNFPEALSNFNKALELDPDNNEIKESIEKVKQKLKP